VIPADNIRGSALPAAQSLELPADQVHVWLANLDSYPAEDLKSLLSNDEVKRAERFHFEKHRNHFIVARGLLRQLLAAYLNTAAIDLKFDYAEKEKPSLGSADKGAINFNLAHSYGRAAYAFSRNRELGIDLELIREDFGGAEIAQRFFSRSEVAALGKVPRELAAQAFFNCWTRKEAYIKAIGEGLSMPLDTFDVTLAPGEPAALLRNHKDSREVERWSMLSIAAPEKFVAALVVEGKDWTLKTFALEEAGMSDKLQLVANPQKTTS
jgi:4'-phosphopantetheinyl transferase